MPTVPTISGRRVAPQGIPNARIESGVSPKSFGSDLSRAASTVGSVFDDIAQDERDKADNAAVQDANNQLNSWENGALFDAQAGAFNRRGKEAFDLPNQVMPTYDEEAKRLEGGLGSERARTVFRSRASDRRAFIERQLNQHEASERNQYYNAQDDASLRSSRGIAANFYNSPERVAAEIRTQESVIDGNGARNNLPQEQVDEAKRATRSGTHTDVVERYLARGEWRRGGTYFEAVRDQIGADDATRIESALTVERRRAEAEARQVQSELRQELSERVRDATAAYRLGLDFDSPPSRTEFVAALGPKSGTKAFESFRGEQQLGADLAQLAILPPADQQTLLNRRAPGQVLTHDGYPAIQNADGTVSTELGITVESEDLNGGRPTNIPSIWQGAKQTQDKAIELALESGRTFEAFDTIDQAVAASKAHSADLGRRIAGEGTAETAERYRVLAGQVEQLRRQREADPATYAVRYSPRVEKAWNAAQSSPEGARAYATATIAEQHRLGVRVPKVLPDAQASAIAQTFYTSTGGEDLVQLVQSEEQKWGPYWPKVFGELAAKKIPPAALAIGRGMEPGAAVRLAGVAALPMEELQKGVATPSADVRDAIVPKMETFQRSLDGVIGAENTFNGMYDAVQRLTYSYLRQGIGAEDAAGQAYNEVLGDHYAFREMNGRTFRVPIAEDSEDVEDGARMALDAVDSGDLAPPVSSSTSSSENAVSDLARAIRKRGYWVTSANGEGGLALFIDGAPVLRHGGEVYSLTWDELRAFPTGERASEEQAAKKANELAFRLRSTP